MVHYVVQFKVRFLKHCSFPLYMYPLERIKGIILPNGYEPSEGNLRIKSLEGRTRIDFKPENRRFSDYDGIIYGLLSRYLIEHQTSNVLDIGGGYKSTAVQEMMEQFPYLTAINIDLFAENTKFSRQGNANSLPVKDLSIDAVVSVHCVSRFLISLRPEGETMVKEMARVLKPDGLAFVWPGFDLTPISKDFEAATQLYGKNTYGLVYRKTHAPYQS